MSFSTSTLIAGAEVVPWLAAKGELAYSPKSPPERDYFFQYSWVVPGILRVGVNKRRHYWFGYPSKDDPRVRLLFRFWNQARRGAYDPLFISHGVAEPATDVTAPVAAYRHQDLHPTGHTTERLILMQHGSYHIGDIVHARSLTDSVVSFNAAHCSLMRCETGYLNDGSFLFDGLCREAGLDPDAPSIRSVVYSGYALEEWCASGKFGPNYVKFRTPLTNLRITTFVANETEVKVIDPNRLEVVEAVGCKVREVCC